MKRPYERTLQLKENLHITISSAYQDDYMIVHEKRDSKEHDVIAIDISDQETRDAIRNLLDLVESTK